MPEIFAPARAWLVANIDPAAPAALLVIAVFLAVYSLRRFAPSTWLRLEHAVPFVDSIDPSPGIKILLKAWQALPGATFGAATAALTSGLSVTHALWGVAAGFGAAVTHEIMSAYQGAVGGPRKPPTAKPNQGAPASVSYVPGKMFPSEPPPSVPPPPAAAFRGLGLAGMMVACCAFLGGCGLLAAAAPYLAEAGVIIADAVNDLDAIEDLVAAFPGLAPSARATIEAKLQAARSALQAAAAADNGATDLTAAQLDASLTAFRAAWTDLSQALEEAGIVSGAKASSMASSGVRVPVPLAMRAVK